MKLRVPAPPGIIYLSLVGLTACGGGSDGNGAAPNRGGDAGVVAGIESALDGGLDRIAARAESVDSVLRPLPLLTSAEESGLRRYLNAQHLERARVLGVPRPSTEQLEGLLAEGSLVELETSTPHWLVGDVVDYGALVTPDTRALLTEIATRFQERLEAMGLPRFRVEVSSALRTAADQAELRETNPNAAAGASTHEFGTTLDVLYSRFAPPESLDDWVDAGDHTWLEPYLQRVAITAAEAIGGRRSREMQAILGYVLLEMQREGKVMVTMERLQPVYHMTVARRY